MELKEVYPGVIWAIQYTGDDKHIFAKRMGQWRDVEYLESFLNKHKQFIENNDHYKGHSLTEVIISVKRDAKQLLKYINTLYENTIKGKRPNFETKFIFLHRPPVDTEQKKARRKLYGRSDDVYDDIDTVFRLYAIRIESNNKNDTPAYIITGGGIKLADNMGKMTELQQEFNRMQSVQEMLLKKGITTKESLYVLNHGNND